MKAAYGWGSVRVLVVFGVVVLAAGSFASLPARAQASSTPIKVGYLGEQIGAEEMLDNLPAFTAWVKWTNAHGGLNGHQVELFSAVEPNNPAVALVDVKKLVGDGIVALVENDSNDAAWSTYINSTGIPVFPNGGGDTTFASQPNDFTPGVSAVYSPNSVMLAAKKIGVKKLAVLYCAELAQCEQAVPFFTAVGKKYGVDVPFSAAVSSSAPNYVAQCLAAKDAGADGLFVAATSTVSVRVAQNCAEQGYTPHLVTSSGAYSRDFAATKGSNGMISAESTAPFFDTKVPAIRTMTDAFNTYEPAVIKSPEYNDQAVLEWASGVLIADAVKAGKVGTTNPITAAALINGVHALGSTNLGGLTPTLTFTPGQPQMNKCFFYAAIKKGKFTTPYGLTPTCVS